MQTISFGSTYRDCEIAVLIKNSAFNKKEIFDNYVSPICNTTADHGHFMAASLAYQPNNKCTVSWQKEYLNNHLHNIVHPNIKLLIVADSNYFKTLTKNVKADPHYGYVCDCAISGYEHIKVVLAPNYQAMLYNKTVQTKLDMSVKTVRDQLNATYTVPGTSIIHSEHYPVTVSEIKLALDRLRRSPELTCDLEARSLEFWNAGIATITFCTNEHNGIAFPVDRAQKHHDVLLSAVMNCRADHIKSLLREFFENYTGTITYHNAGFDMKLLAYELWMKNLGDYKGMIDGIEVLTKNFHDTKIISYLATNNAFKNNLKLKDLAQEFAGNYAMDDINDTTKIPIDKLLKYNLVDGLSTWYVKNKYYPLMVKDRQLGIYQDLLRPAVKNILQMELCGMPIDPKKVQKAKRHLVGIVSKHKHFLENTHIIKDFEYIQKMRMAADLTKKAKVKVYSVNDPIVARHKFNPGSSTQLIELIYDYLGYAVIDKTKSKQPATGAKTLEKLINHATDPAHKEIFKNLIGLGKASKVLTAFIPAFENAQQLPDGSWRLYGFFNLGGTQSGRLSSSNPNLQNIPSGSTYAKIIKECFCSPPGWIFCGADFRALEAMTNALITGDPNKLKVYTDGFDSHCLNAFAYFSADMPDIVNTVASINSIELKYNVLRSKSKAPTFALQYEGTVETLMRSLGIPRAEAQVIYDNFHILYVASDIWAEKLIQQASKDGYITCAFGLKLRAPVLGKTVLGTRSTPYKAQAERRSVLNAKTQSYGMLNTRAGNAFQGRCLASKFKYDIMPAAQIHDAAYFLVRDNANAMHFVNQNLIKEMSWQNLPELKHPSIKMGAELELFWPSWDNKLKLPNSINKATIKKLCSDHKIKVKP